MDPVASPSQPHPAPQEGASLIQILLILRRRWRLLAIVWVATVAAGAIYTFSLTSLYRPQASLEIRPEAPVVAGDPQDPAMMASRMMWENYYRTQEQILTSPTLIDATIKALPEAIRKKFDGKTDRIKAFTEKLDIEKVRTSFIIKIGFVDESAANATQVVNTLVQLYLEDANRRLRDLKSDAAEVLTKKTLPDIRKLVEDADNAVQGFQGETGFVDFEEHYKSLVEARRKFDARFTEIRLRRVRVRAELEALQVYGGNGVSGLFNPAFHSTRTLEPLADQRSRIAGDLGKAAKLYKEGHPAIIELREQLRMIEEKVREAIQGTLRALESDLAAVEAEEKALAEELDKTEKGMVEAARSLNRFKRLESELVSAKELYNSYLKKHGETTATSGTTLGSVRIIDHATIPIGRFKPKILTNLVVGLMVGLLLGVAAIFVTEHLDDRIASPKEIEAFVGLDVLAVIPRLSLAEKAGDDPILLGEDSALPEFEAFRGLRSEVVTRLERVQGPKVLCVLSALQSEGKSTVTANLARVLAMEGRKVLIFDADMRRPSQRSLIGTKGGVGLEQVLRGEAPLDQAVQTSRIKGVDVLGAREGTTGAAELAGTKQFEDAISWARSNYDFVLIDSAPVMQGSESALVARRADAAILVIRDAQTSRAAALAARRRLAGLGVQLIGAVLNCASSNGASYGYGYYSYPYYGTSKG